MGRQSRERKKRLAAQNPDTGKGAQPEQPPAPTPPAIPDSGAQKRFAWKEALPVLAILISICSALFSYQQHQVSKASLDVSKNSLDVSRATLDRATGKVAPKVEFAEFWPLPTDFRDDQKVEFADTKEKRPYYKDANALVLLAPMLTMNNVGEEPIDAVRIETAFREGMIDSRGEKFDSANPPADWYKADTPVILRKTEKDEHILTKQWKPGDSIQISLLKGMLGQMAQVQSKVRTNRVHYARLEFSVSARLTGSTAFHSDGNKGWYMVAWLPSGFPEEECKRILDNYQPRISFGAKVPRRIGQFTGHGEDLRMFNGPNYAEPKP